MVCSCTLNSPFPLASGINSVLITVRLLLFTTFLFKPVIITAGLHCAVDGAERVLLLSKMGTSIFYLAFHPLLEILGGR